MPPAAWYDDPEDPSQYRYWDGTNWTEHRSPKTMTATPKTQIAGSPWSLFPMAFNSIGATWRQLILISIPNLVTSVIMLVAIYATVDQVFDGDLDEIVDRATDGYISPSDETYFENLDVTFPVPMFWVALGAFAAAMLVGVVVGAAMQHTMAASMRGRRLEAGEAFRGAWRRLGRLIGWPIVFALIAVAALIPGLVLPPLFLLYIPLVIWLWPYLVALLPALALAPAGRSPISQVREMLGGRWGFAAVRCLVLTLLWLAVGFGSSIVNQIFIFDIRASIVGSTITGIVQGVLTTAGMVAWWMLLSGPLDPELEAVGEDEPQPA